MTKSNTKFMLLESRQTLAINAFQVSQVTRCAKPLGVHINDKLDWSVHVEKVTKKVDSGIGSIKQIRHLVPQRPYI